MFPYNWDSQGFLTITVPANEALAREALDYGRGRLLVGSEYQEPSNTVILHYRLKMVDWNTGKVTWDPKLSVISELSDVGKYLIYLDEDK